jgi:mannonate dehydratase
MKIGLGLYRHQLNRPHYEFALQCGATHLVAHLVDYFRQGEDNPADNQPTGDRRGWGLAGDPDRLWSLAELVALKREINDAGLELEAIENFDPAHWHDVLLDGPRKQFQLENLKTLIRHVGEAEIPIFGYNFSIAGVGSRITGPFARGGANSVGMEGVDDTPIPHGMVWNMVYDRNAAAGVLPEIDHDELWRRLEYFLEELLPVAERAGVRLAAHPDDPPAPRVRRQPRLVYQPSMYQRLIDIDPSPSNALEMCVGTLAEMTEGDIYETVDHYSRQGRVAYVHLRNVRGKVPSYRETFIDDGDVDMARVLRILDANQFDGVVIPDHTPQMTCDAPWHAGMAFALGYVNAVLQGLR